MLPSAGIRGRTEENLLAGRKSLDMEFEFFQEQTKISLPIFRSISSCEPFTLGLTGLPCDDHTKGSGSAWAPTVAAPTGTWTMLVCAGFPGGFCVWPGILRSPRRLHRTVGPDGCSGRKGFLLHVG